MIEHEKHLTEYILLGLGLIALVVLFVLFSHSFTYQLIIGGLICLCFVLWGVFHHKKEERLKTKVVTEYILFSALVFALIFIVLNLL